MMDQHHGNSSGANDKGASQGRAHSRQGGRISSAARLSQTADAQREEELDKTRVEQLNRQIEMNNAEILDNWDQIAIMKRNIFRVVQARQQNVDPAQANQIFKNNP